MDVLCVHFDQNQQIKTFIREISFCRLFECTIFIYTKEQ